MPSGPPRSSVPSGPRSTVPIDTATARNGSAGSAIQRSVKRMSSPSSQPAVEARQRADHHADHGGEQRHAQRDLQRDLATVQHAGERVAAELVGAEPVGRRRTRRRLGEVLIVRVLGEARADEAGQEHEHQEAEADHRRRVCRRKRRHAARHSLPSSGVTIGLRPRASRVDRLRPGPARLVADAHAHGVRTRRRYVPLTRIRGSSTA